MRPQSAPVILTSPQVYIMAKISEVATPFLSLITDAKESGIQMQLTKKFGVNL
jgi:hypothetical protein